MRLLVCSAAESLSGCSHTTCWVLSVLVLSVLVLILLASSCPNSYLLMVGEFPSLLPSVPVHVHVDPGRRKLYTIDHQ